jgi:hypothetical protein
MPVMFRRLTFLVVALLLTAAPLVHQHPLDPTSATSSTTAHCAVCASAAKLPQLSPSIHAPRVLVYSLDVAVQLVVSSSAASSTPSRAPPAQ